MRSLLLKTVIATLMCLQGQDATGQEIQRLPGTAPLNIEGDIASLLVQRVDDFLLHETSQASDRRRQHWQSALAEDGNFPDFISLKRKRLAYILGVRDERIGLTAPELIASTQHSALIAKSDRTEVWLVRWPVFKYVTGEGLLLVPVGREIIGDIVAIPDADQTPEQFAGLVAGVAPELQFAGRLADAGYRVIVPTLINRSLQRRAPAGQAGRANLTNREYVYRPAFELGRHIIGYELQKILACIDWFDQEQDARGTDHHAASHTIGVVGYGEGGMLALYAAALDERIEIACISGFFGPLDAVWREPIDRNIFGLLTDFGGAELACMTYPRSLCVDFRPGPSLEVPSEGGAPGTLRPATSEEQKSELAAAVKLLMPRFRADAVAIQESQESLQSAQCGVWLEASSGPNASPRLWPIDSESDPATADHQHIWKLVASSMGPPELVSTEEVPDAADRQQRQLQQLDDFNQRLLSESRFVRQEFMQALDTTSLAAYERSVESYRELFREQVIGDFDLPLAAFNARSRATWKTDAWTGYEVMLDVFPDVFAYGVLLVPAGIPVGEQRPVVVCQHGLEGRPTDTFQGDHPAYHDFAAQLCERGFVTFAPQNIYIFNDRFRTLQRKANPLGKTLFSVMVPQHQQIVNWLGQLSFVDPERIAFYGLSYGGKSAMRIPALVTDYCLSICSADFNEWVWKNASTRDNFSYVWTGEYEIFEWDLGSTFNYSEMAALICPRPFMVERGHFDGVGDDEWVAFEFAKVRRLYQARLGIGDRTEIEWFSGPHTIHGEGTFRFLHRYLNWQTGD